MKVDVIVNSGSAVPALKEATSVIPIVFAAGSDPVGSGYVSSLARPGGNVTGLSLQATETAGKRVELLREIVPDLHRLAIVANIGNPSNVLDMGGAQAAARTLGLEVAKFDFRRAEDISGFEVLNRRGDALYFCNDPLFFTNRIRINALALGAKLPTTFGFREHVEAGGLMSYGANFPNLFRRAAGESDRNDNVLAVRVCLLESNDPINRRSGGTSSAMSHLYRAPQEEHKIA